MLAGLVAFAFVVVYVGSGWFLPDWHWQITERGWSAFFTPLLGVTASALSLVLVGVGLVLWAKKLLPHEIAVQDQHDGSHFDRGHRRRHAGRRGFHNSGLARRKLITRSLRLHGRRRSALMLIMPLGGLIKNPNKGNPLRHHRAGPKGVRLVRNDGTPDPPRRPASPARWRPCSRRVPGGNQAGRRRRRMLIRLRPEQVAGAAAARRARRTSATATTSPTRRSAPTPAARLACTSSRPAGLLCPCHQSQFLDHRQGAKPVFGPATRPLPQLPARRSTTRATSSPRSDYTRPSAPATGTGSASDGSSHRHRAGRPDHRAGQGRRTSSTTACIVAAWLRRTLNKVFPDHWSFLLGEIALYSFIILLLTGTYLTFFFDPSMREVVYNGTLRAAARRGDVARRTTRRCDISFDVRGGLFMRQMHHWAALLFVAAIVVHMLRIFFTGAFRKPRETNWIIGVVMLFCSACSRASPATRCPTTCSPAPACGSLSAIMLSIPVDRHLGALRGLRRRVPRRADHRPVLHRPRAADPGDPARADRGCTC